MCLDVVGQTFWLFYIHHTGGLSGVTKPTVTVYRITSRYVTAL